MGWINWKPSCNCSFGNVFFFVKCIYVFILMLLTSNSLQHDLYVYIYLSYSTVFNFIWIFKIKLFLTLNKFIFYRFSQCFQHIQYLFLMVFFLVTFFAYISFNIFYEVFQNQRVMTYNNKDNYNDNYISIRTNAW